MPSKYMWKTRRAKRAVTASFDRRSPDSARVARSRETNSADEEGALVVLRPRWAMWMCLQTECELESDKDGVLGEHSGRGALWPFLWFERQSDVHPQCDE